jgi:hypothetical protein
MDHFHLTPDEIGRLTEREIAELCFHKRNKDGSIKIEKTERINQAEATTLAEELLAVDQLVWKRMISPEQAEALKAELRRKDRRQAD